MMFRRTTFIGSAIVVLTVGCAAAQSQQRHDVVIATQSTQVGHRAGGDVLVHSIAGPGTPVEFLSAEFGVAGKVVKGAPYSADAVTESIQTLADGNRITHKSSTTISRDSEGRTRRDVSLAAGGPWSGEAKALPKISVIFDPVADTSYTLDHNSKIARKMPGRGFTIQLDRAGVGGMGVPSVPATATFERRIEGAPMMVLDGRDKAGKTESLGKQTIEGVMAEGTRTVVTIPAGQIGNDRPIEIVSERWYSPELQALVMTRNVDPRNGENVYKLTNLRRSEPLKSLFEVPADYTIEAETPHMRQMRIREKE